MAEVEGEEEVVVAVLVVETGAEVLAREVIVVEDVDEHEHEREDEDEGKEEEEEEVLVMGTVAEVAAREVRLVSER